AQSYWDGPFYRPPGILVELLGDRIRLTRSDNKVFRKPNGEPITQQGGKVLDIPLADADRASYTFPDGTTVQLPAVQHDGDDPATHDPNPNAFPGDKQ